MNRVVSNEVLSRSFRQGDARDRKRAFVASRTAERAGVTLVLLAILLPVVLAVAAYAINVSYMELARTELQITTDLATRAAGRVLAATGDEYQAVLAAERLMDANPFANEKLTLSGSDIVFGVSTRYTEDQRYSFGPGANPNAVQIQASGRVEVPLLFPTMGIPVEFRPIKTAISTQSEMDIAIVLDRSGSMAYSAYEVAGDYEPAHAPLGWAFGLPAPPASRWLDAVSAVDVFTELIRETQLAEHVCLATYNESAAGDIKLTDDYSSIKFAMQQYSNRFNGGATNIGDGMIEAASLLSDKRTARPWAARAMIVLTDGIHNTGTDPIVAAQLAAANNIVIFTVTFSNEADVARMKEVAAIGLGNHIHAANGAQLAEAFREISRRLPTLITY